MEVCEIKLHCYGTGGWSLTHEPVTHGHLWQGGAIASHSNGSIGEGLIFHLGKTLNPQKY